MLIKTSNNQGPSFWDKNPDKLDKMIKLWLKGISAGQIARIIAPRGEITRNAVIGKAHRLGLKQHHKARILDSTYKVPKSPKDPKASRVRIRVTSHSKNVAGLEDVFEKVDGLKDLRPEVQPTAVSLYDAKPDQCRWPIQNDPFMYCGAIVEEDSKLTFCVCHYKRAINRQDNSRGKFNIKISKYR